MRVILNVLQGPQAGRTFKFDRHDTFIVGRSRFVHCPIDDAALSRDHTIHVSKSGLLTIAGGKWTTYRKMAEDCVDHAATLGKLDERTCVTKTLKIHGWHANPEQFGDLKYYGADALRIRAIMDVDAALANKLHPDVPVFGAQVVWAAREEMARTVDDVLARRTRALFLEARAAVEIAPEVARLLATELRRDETWQVEQVNAFTTVAQNYLVQA